MSYTATVLVGGLGVAIAGCGGSGDASPSTAADGGQLSTSTGRTTIAGKQRPKVEVPDIPRPTKLVVKDPAGGKGSQSNGWR